MGVGLGLWLHSRTSVQLDQDQIDKLKQQMMVKYDEVNREYQKLTHLQKLDTLPKLRK